MNIQYVVFRYEPDLREDGWIPLGLVAERRIGENETEAAVVCLKNLNIDEKDEFMGAILRNISGFLRRGVEQSRIELLPRQDLLERLRDKHKWNFHFSVPQETTVEYDALLQAAHDLFGKEVLQTLSARGLLSPSPHKATICPQGVEMYGVAV
jgi:hypothetical protein